jgi:hypothetical protein
VRGEEGDSLDVGSGVKIGLEEEEGVVRGEAVERERGEVAFFKGFTAVLIKEGSDL